jgi:hypothetical protein
MIFWYNTLFRILQRLFIEAENWNDLNISVNSDRALEGGKTEEIFKMNKDEE